MNKFKKVKINASCKLGSVTPGKTYEVLSTRPSGALTILDDENDVLMIFPDEFTYVE